MKRPPPSFVVEVRRQRRPAGEPVRSWFEEPEPVEAAPSIQAVFAEPPPASVESAPARPVGRILPSLIEPPPAAEEPPAVKPRKVESRRRQDDRREDARSQGPRDKNSRPAPRSAGAPCADA